MTRPLALLSFGLLTVHAGAAAPKFNDPQPQAYHLTVRASEVDPAAKAYPDIDFNLESKGKPADVQTADVTRASLRAANWWSG